MDRSYSYVFGQLRWSLDLHLYLNIDQGHGPLTLSHTQVSGFLLIILGR